MGSEMGLLSLPPEIRDQIYTTILHPDNNRIHFPNEYSKYNFRGALVLFRLNRQIYHEARDVLRRLNVFVRIETPWSEVEKHVYEIGHTPILVYGPPASRFNWHTLQVTVETPTLPTSEDGPCHFVMLADDLPAFTKTWFYWHLSHLGLNQWLALKLHLRDPYAPDRDEIFTRREIQRKLFLPFGDIKGLHSVSVIGDSAPNATIVAEMRALQAVEPASPEQCLVECIRLKNEGNALLQEGEMHAALEVYTRAWEAIHIVIKGQARHIHAERYFARNLVDEPFEGKNGQIERMSLRLQLVANTCLAYLKLCDWEQLLFWGMRTIRLMRQASGANEHPVPPEDEALLGFPNSTLVGKIYFRTAMAFKALGDKHEAKRLLRVAHIYLPHDKIVRTELASIASQ
ncbi:hypothetical protein GGR50DRAFT_256800 [Xylaria sp. CBS 124048]|nr:hypothetical protein GGR50DRAFT_256800 [Xylaria sp. CBS 124048]